MNEQFSALVDGELDGKEGDALLARLKADTELQDGWDHYHLIGDAMRQNRQLDINITAAVHARLADEPTVLAPAALPQPASRTRRASRWVSLALAASAALVAVIVGVQSENLSEDAQLASAVLSTPAPEAYETLLLDAMRGDATLFMRADQVESAWKVVMPSITNRALQLIIGKIRFLLFPILSVIATVVHPINC